MSEYGRKYVTLKEIATAMNLSKSTVANALGNTAWQKYKPSTVALVRETAEKMGYVKKSDRKAYYEAHRTCWFNGNFRTKAEEVAHMKGLREQGYTNLEIAKMTGRCVQTVYNSIGKQDEEMTAMSIQLRGIMMKQRNAARCAYKRNKTIADYNRKVAEYEAVKAKAEQMMMEIKVVQPTVTELAKSAVTAPNMDIRNLEPTLLN